MEHIDRRMLMAGMILLPVTARAARLGSGAEQAGLDALVRKWANEQGFRGLVALGRKGHATASSAQGFANVEMRLPFDLDVPMAIASISKRITAVAVMRLVERGQLALDTPIARYLPAYRKDIGAQVTLRHLLSNSSGIPNQFGAVVRARPELFGKDMPAGEAVSLFASGDLVFAPGTRFDYALTNWILVLAILETVSGARFPDLVRNLVTAPLRLGATRLEQLGDSMSYRTLDPPTVWASPTADYLAAGGGFCGTGRDLMRFAHRVYGTSFLTADSRHALTTIEVASDHYALGGRVREVTIAGKAVRCAWDTGNRAGYRSVLGHRLDGKGTVVVLNNTGYSQKTMDEVAEAALRLQAG
ncbi:MULTISPECIES: serine hydrolase [unclassified Sphingomonas]|uniref:serine hydrolase domain-containing protein n=1 Tax=Sphingomonas TaxID=13687 RepID=UPI001AD5FFFF|nr:MULTISPECIES: serine hydrolase domain-containing protein [unclassified Sphingomonas]MBN8812956.1 beta-lactamase family protein [Sphingomonas sp.]